MSQWKNDDSAANSVLWGVAGYKVTANAANRDAFFGNTTANALIDGITVGQYGEDASEAAAKRAAGVARPAHAGWVNKVTGQGGRAGRIQYEVLVAMGSMSGDAEDTTFPDYTIAISSQPSNRTVNASSTSNTTTFGVTAATTPTGGTLSYFWQKYNGSAFANLSNAGAYSNVTTATMTVKANTASNGEIYRAGVAVTGGTTVYSSNAVITITT